MTTQNMNEALLTPREVAARFRVSTRTLETWRFAGRGPKYLRIGGHVRYRPSDIHEWEEHHSYWGGE